MNNDVNELIPAPLRTPVFSSLKLLHCGKVREIYGIPDYPEDQIVVGSDRISAHDFVFNARIPFKGEALTLMSVFTAKELLPSIRIRTDLRATGDDIRNFFPGLNRNILLRSTIVRKAKMLRLEVVSQGRNSLWTSASFRTSRRFQVTCSDLYTHHQSSGWT